jgi:adenosine deaminase
MAGLSDLHRHLDGSLRRATLDELARRGGVEVPDDVGFSAGMGLERALACFGITLSVLQELDAVRRVASEMCEDAATDGVTTLEIRFAPQLHGKPVSDVVDAALDGIAGRAGVILCGLYGEPPALLEELVDVAADRVGVVGIDLAGGPTPGAEWGMASYAGAYRKARELGIGRTVHAGEGRSAAEIAMAIDVLGAQRIGHGTTLLEDGRVVDLVLERGVTIEACPTSNVHTGVIRTVEEHPLPRWLELGVRACVNTDNTLFSRVSASEEHARVAAIPGMSNALLSRAVAHGHAARFVRS